MFNLIARRIHRIRVRVTLRPRRRSAKSLESSGSGDRRFESFLASQLPRVAVQSIPTTTSGDFVLHRAKAWTPLRLEIAQPTGGSSRSDGRGGAPISTTVAGAALFALGATFSATPGDPATMSGLGPRRVRGVAETVLVSAELSPAPHHASVRTVTSGQIDGSQMPCQGSVEHPILIGRPIGS
jgi:hypothetical protein